MTAAREAGRTGLYPLCLLLAFGGIWAATLAVAKFAAGAGVPPIALAFWQSFGGGLVVLAIAQARGQPIRFGRPYLRYYLIGGFVGLAWPNAVSFLAVPQLGTGLLSLLFTLAPVLTYLIAQALRIERFFWIRGAGIALGFLGMLAILTPRASLPSPDALFWALVAMTAPLSLAIGNIYRSLDWPAGADPLALSAGLMLGSSLLLLPAMLATGAWMPLPPFGAAEWATAAQAGATGVAYILLLALQRAGGPVYLSQVGYVVALTGILLGIALYGETLESSIWLAVGLLFAGVALVNRRPPPRSDR